MLAHVLYKALDCITFGMIVSSFIYLKGIYFMKAGIVYQCFVTDEELNNHYTEFVLDRSIDEPELEQAALTKLGVIGSLCSYATELVELTKADKAYVMNFLVTAGGQQQLLETSIKSSRNGYIKMLNAAEWLVGTRSVSLIPFGTFNTIPVLRPGEVNHPPPANIDYLDMRLLSAIRQQEFTTIESLSKAVKGGAAADMENKYTRIKELQNRNLVEHTEGVFTLTTKGDEALGQLEAPIDLNKEDEIAQKEYPIDSGVSKLSKTANKVLCIFQVEKQLTKAKLKQIASVQKIPDVFGSIGKSVDVLRERGILHCKETDTTYGDLPESTLITLIEETKGTREAFTLEFVRDNPRAFRAKVWERILEDTPKGQQPTLKTNSERFLKELTALGILVEPAGLTEAIKKPDTFIEFIESYFE